MRAIGNDQFVQSMSTNLTRLRDKKSHFFPWAVSRDQRVSNSGNSIEAKLAVGFSLEQHVGTEFNIQFHDIDTRDRYLGDVKRVANLWQSACREDPEISQTVNDGRWEKAVKIFNDREPNLFLEAHLSSAREFYWECGSYEIEVTIKTSRPEKEFKFKANFLLSEEDAASLRVNINTMLVMACMPPTVNLFALSGKLNFVYPRVDWLRASV